MKKILLAVCSSILVLAVCPVSAQPGVRLVLEPATASLGTNLTIELSLDNDIEKSQELAITLPGEMRVPQVMPDGMATVNSMPVKGIAIVDHTIRFALPEPQEQRKNLVIVFPVSAGLKNPLRAGAYNISVAMDNMIVWNSVQVERILPHAPKVSVKPDKVGKTIGVTIQILHPEGLVVSKDDALNVVFPPEFSFPKEIDPQEVKVCGLPPTALLTDSGTMTMVIAKDIPVSEPITVVIGSGFGLTSPLWPGNFSLVVGIPGKMEDTRSETFQIFALSPTLSLVIDPPMPQSGWYPTLPSIQIVSSAKREIYYSWDSQSRTAFSEPIKPETGIHVLSYVGRIENGGWETELFETFRIDLDEPAFIAMPGSYNNETMKMTYRVEDTSQCISGVGNLEAGKTGFNTFEIELDLKPGSNSFVFWAEDVVGRRIEKSHQIILDKTPPALTVITPAQTSVVCGKEISVTGKTEANCRIEVNGNTVLPNSKGDFTGVIKPVDEGPMDIIVTSTDPAGNQTTKTVSILYIKSTRISVKLDSRQATVAGKTKEIELAPYERFGTIYIPLPAIAGWLGYKISSIDGKSWLLEDNIGTRVSFALNDNNVSIKTKQGNFTKTLDNSPEIRDGIICVPVEFIDKGLGLETLVDSNLVTILFCPR